MFKLISCTATLLLASLTLSLASPAATALEAREKAAWQAFKDRDAAGFEKIVGARMVAVYNDGVANLKKELADMKKWDMKSFSLSDYKVTAFGSDTMASSYTVTVAGTFNGQDASGTYYAGSVWKMENGEWHAVFHTNVLRAGAAAGGH